MTAGNASIHGPTLVFEDKYQNLGFWTSTDDFASWSLSVAAARKYKVVLDYACENSSAGNSFQLEVGDRKLTGTVRGTGSWDDYRTVEIGTLELPAGDDVLSLRTGGPLKNALLDLHSIRLMPAAD